MFYYCKNMRASQRIGPHNEDVISVLVGLMLGDGHARWMRNGGIRFAVCMSAKNIVYLHWLHSFFVDRGYCPSKIPAIKERRRSTPGVYQGRIYLDVDFNTYTFSSLNFLHDAFYDFNKKKIIPATIEQLLTPLSLAIWIMDDGTAHNNNRGLRLCTDSFTLDECKLLQTTLLNKWGFVTSLHHRNMTQYRIYFGVKQMPNLINLIKPHILPTMRYKLGFGT